MTNYEIAKLKNEIDILSKDLAKAVAEQDYEAAATIHDQHRPLVDQLKEALNGDELKAAWDAFQKAVKHYGAGAVVTMLAVPEGYGENQYCTVIIKGLGVSIEIGPDTQVNGDAMYKASCAVRKWREAVK